MVRSHIEDDVDARGPSVTWSGPLSSCPVGRSVEVDRLVRVLDGSAGPAHASLLLLGARGVGRTAVLDAAVAKVPGPLVRLVGGPSPADAPLTGLLHVVDEAATQPAFARLVPVLAEVVDRGAVAPYDLGRRLLTALRTTGRQQPAVLVIDDVHRYELQTRQVLGQLAHHGAGAGLRMLLTADEDADLAAFSTVERVRLAPLPVRQLRRVLERDSGASVPFRVARSLHRWTGGNPGLALDVAAQLEEAELSGRSPLALPLTPSRAYLRHAGQRVLELAPEDQKVLAVFAQEPSLPVEALPAATGSPPAVVEDLVARDWLVLRQRTLQPRHPGEALLARAALSPSCQQEGDLRLARRLAVGDPASADYFAALGGAVDAARRLPAVVAELYRSGERERAAAAALLALRLGGQGPDELLSLARLLVADGYTAAVRGLLPRLQATADPGGLCTLLAELASVSSDLIEAQAALEAGPLPGADMDEWLRAALLVGRLQLGLDGAEELTRMLTGVEPLLEGAAPSVRTVAQVVRAERDVYLESPGSADRLLASLRHWLRDRPDCTDPSGMSAALDLMSLDQVQLAGALVVSAGPPELLPFATTRSALLMLRTEVEIAAGNYHRAADLLLESERALPSLNGASLLLLSQVIRIRTVCGDLPELDEVEERLQRPPGAALTYLARRAHTAALGFRELVAGDVARSADLLALALQGPSLLLQGRSSVLADLVEATAAGGRREQAGELWRRLSAWLPDAAGDRSPGLLARCAAMVAPPEEVDERFATALAAHPFTHEVDRARTLLAWGRTLVLLGRTEDAVPRLRSAAAMFAECRLPGWSTHVERLLDGLAPTDPAPVAGPLSVHGGLVHGGLVHGGLVHGGLVHGGPELTRLGLTEVESRVLTLVLERRRNRDIAADLYVSLRTVEGHLTRLYRKLGVTTKAQLYRELGRRPAGFPATPARPPAAALAATAPGRQ